MFIDWQETGGKEAGEKVLKKGILFEKKLIIPMAIIMIVLLVIFGLAASATRNSAIKKKEQELITASTKETMQFRAWNNEMLNKFSRFIEGLAKNEELSRLQVKNAMSLAKADFQKEKGIFEFYVGYEDNENFFSLFGKQAGRDYIAKEEQWYKEAVAADDKVAQSIYVDINTNKTVLCFSKKIVVDGVKGVIAVDFWLDELIEKFGVFENGYIFFVDDKKDIIYHPDSEFAPTYEEKYNISVDSLQKFGALHTAIKEKDSRIIKGGTFFHPEYMLVEKIGAFNCNLVAVSDGFEVLFYAVIFTLISIVLVGAVLFGGIMLSVRMSKGKAVAVSRFIKQKGFIRSLFVVLFLTILLAAIAFSYVNTIRSINKEELFKNTAELAIKSAELVKKQIENDFRTVVSTASMIGEYPDIDVQRAMVLLKEEVAVNKFKRMGMIDLEGNVVTTDGLNDNFAKRSYFNRALAGTTNISDTIIDSFDQKPINVYATPIYTSGKLVGALIATIGNEEFTELLSVPTFQGMGYSYVIKSTGERVVASNHVMSERDFDNIFDIINDKSAPQESIDTMKESMQNGYGGMLYYERFDEGRYLNYEPIGINDWYICSIMSEALLTEKSNKIISISLIGSVAIVCLFGLLMLFIVLSQRNVKRKLSYLAYVDPVTGYGNMNMFTKDVHMVLGQQSSQLYAMVAVDIDKFKTVNDILGRKNGDDILKHCADVIAKKLSDGEYVCRNVSDHFFVLLRYAEATDIIARIKDISDKMRNYTVGVNILLSFGIYEIADESESIETMCYYATIAKTTIKGKHDTNFAFYSRTVRNEMLAEKDIENTMYQALENEEFVVFLQPKYNMNTCAIVGAEALVRWIKPDKKIIPPDSFIPLFERNGFIIKLDYYIWEQVIKTIAKWVECGQAPVQVSINVSRRHFMNFDFVDVLKELLERYQVDKSLIEVELTESAFADKDIVIYDVAKRLSENGFHKSIDDFGTGYSSLNLLRKIDVEVIKIDKEFLDNAAVDFKGEIVLRNIVSMIRQLNMNVVVEGVETAEHVRFLTEIDCEIAQGYFYAKPLPIANFEKLLFGQ